MIRGLQAAGRTVFLTTHNLAEAQLLCHRVAVLERGRLRAIGTPEELAGRLGGVRLVLEVTPATLPAALSLLPKAERRENGSLSVPGVRREEVPALVSRLAAGGVGLYRVSLEEPSLEDVYFALHAEEAP